MIGQQSAGLVKHEDKYVGDFYFVFIILSPKDDRCFNVFMNIEGTDPIGSVPRMQSYFEMSIRHL